MEILIKNATIVTMNRDRDLIKGGSILISGQKIAKIGKVDEFKGERAEFEIDARGEIVMPGLINPHVHLSYSLAKGCGDGLQFTDWLPVVFKVEDSYADEDWYIASLLSMVEMIKSGTTCFGDTNVYQQVDFVARAVEDSGIRGVLGKKVFDATQAEIEKVPWYKKAWDTEKLSISQAVTDYERWNAKAQGRIKMGFGPQAWPGCSADGYKKIAKLSREMHVVNLIHHTEARLWADYVKQNYGKLPTMMLEDFGILGPNTLLENAPIITDDELTLISRTRTCFNWLATSNVKNFMGVVDLTLLLKEGTAVSLGTSGGLINNVNDIFREMKTVALQLCQLKRSHDAITPQAVLEMATLGGARGLSLENEVGSLEPGKKADVIIVNTKQPHLYPLINPVSTLVYGANGGDVETSIIDGRIVMLDRKLLTIDENELLRKSEEATERMLGKTGLGEVRSP